MLFTPERVCVVISLVRRAAVNDVWKANLTLTALSRSALKNMRKSWGPPGEGAEQGLVKGKGKRRGGRERAAAITGTRAGQR